MVSIDDCPLPVLEGFAIHCTAFVVSFLIRAEATGNAFAERFTAFFWLKLAIFFLVVLAAFFFWLELAVLFWLTEPAARGAWCSASACVLVGVPADCFGVPFVAQVTIKMQAAPSIKMARERDFLMSCPPQPALQTT